MSSDMYWIEQWKGGDATNFTPYSVEDFIFGTLEAATAKAAALNASDRFNTYRAARMDRRHDALDGHCEPGCTCPGWGPDLSPLTREERAARYIWKSGKSIHTSDCATSLAPAEEPGPCDCDAVEAPAIARAEGGQSCR